MPQRISDTPNELERRVLDVAWDLEKVTVRQVHERVREHTSLTHKGIDHLLEGMATKGFLKRIENTHPKLYVAAIEKNATYRALVNRLAEGYGASTTEMYASLLKDEPPMPESELRLLLAMIEKLERER